MIFNLDKIQLSLLGVELSCCFHEDYFWLLVLLSLITPPPVHTHTHYTDTYSTYTYYTHTPSSRWITLKWNFVNLAARKCLSSLYTVWREPCWYFKCMPPTWVCWLEITIHSKQYFSLKCKLPHTHSHSCRITQAEIRFYVTSLEEKNFLLTSLFQTM